MKSPTIPLHSRSCGPHEFCSCHSLLLAACSNLHSNVALQQCSPESWFCHVHADSAMCDSAMGVLYVQLGACMPIMRLIRYKPTMIPLRCVVSMLLCSITLPPSCAALLMLLFANSVYPLLRSLSLRISISCLSLMSLLPLCAVFFLFTLILPCLTSSAYEHSQTSGVVTHHQEADHKDQPQQPQQQP